MSAYYNKDYKDYTPKEPSLPKISGSGGCFPADTFARTYKGIKPIQYINKRELVLAYDKQGAITIGVVEEVTIHKKGTWEGDLYFIYSDDKSLFPKGITGNHAVYDKGTNEHKEISEFKVGDSLTDINGTLIKITKISIDTSFNEEVYNLTISPQHTYLVGDLTTAIRVHNGGGGKGPAGPGEVDDTLKSVAWAKVLEVLSHGQIVGVLGGMKGVYLNSTVLQNTDGTLNFEGAFFDERVGLPSQAVLKGFEEVHAEMPIASTHIDQTGVITQLPNKNIDSALITVQFPDGLWRYIASNGAVIGHQVAFEIFVKNRLSNTWLSVIRPSFSDKVTTKWEMAIRVPAPTNATNWDIKVVRRSVDDPDSTYHSDLNLVRIAEIQHTYLQYNNTALAGMAIKATTTGNSIPIRAYDVMGLIVAVPVNYNVVLRTYGNAYWNGNFTHAWTDNPAWTLFDAIINKEYGLAAYSVQPIVTDVWSFYEASLYNDCASWNGSGYDYNLLDDGVGGLEVRFLFNAVINTQVDAWQLIQAIASTMRAVVTVIGGRISLIQDRPKIANRVFNNASVIDGLFTYASTSSLDRATAVNITFNDKADRFLPRPVLEDDPAAIYRFGYKVKNVVAYGCTSESQARRYGKWILDTELNQPELVTFSVALNIVDIAVGQVVKIMDNDYISDTNKYLTGRIVSVNGTTVVLDAPITMDAGYTYILGVTSADKKGISEVTIVSTGTTDTITINTTLPPGDYVNNTFFCYSTGYIEPKTVLILAIKEDDLGKYTISAVNYDINKYARVEQGITVLPVPTTLPISMYLPPVENIVFSEVFVNTGLAKDNYILVEWEWDEAHLLPDIVTYNINWRLDSGQYTVVSGITSKNFQIPSLIPGIYEVYIEARNLQGKRSQPIYGRYDYRTIAGVSTLEPPINFYVRGTQSNIFSTRDIPLSWEHNPNNDFKTDTLTDYVLEVWTTNGLVLLSTFIVAPNAAKGGFFDYTISLNIADYNSPQRSVQFKIHSRDAIGDLSIPDALTCNNPVPGIPSFNVIAGYGNAYVDITNVLDLDLAGYIVYRNTVSGYTPAPSDIIYQGTNNYITVTAAENTVYYYRVAAYDTFGTTGLNISGEISSSAFSGKVDSWIFTGLDFTTNDPSQDQVSWASGTASKNGGTPIAISAGTTGWVTPDDVYIYYDGTSSTLSYTTDLVVAVTGVMILATYKGDDQIVAGNGSAYIDGQLIIAGTVGASQLVVNQAIITGSVQIASAIIQSTHIIDGAIDNAKIGNTIESANFNPTLHTGWQIDKLGNILSYGTFDLLDQNGTPVLSSGANPTIDWNFISGTGLPADNATVGATFGVNIGGQITPANVTTYIASAAIRYAQIGQAQVGTLSIAGNAVTVPSALYSPGAKALGSTWNVYETLVVPAQPVGYQLSIVVTCDYNTQLTQDINEYWRAVFFAITVNGIVYFNHFRRAGSFTTSLQVYIPPSTNATILFSGHQFEGFGGTSSNRSILAIASKR